MNFPLRRDLGHLALLAAFSAFLFGVNLGGFGLLDPDEPFYSLTAKEMLQRGDPSTPVIFGHPQFEKPIFFYWVLYASFALFGVSEWSARLGPCLAGILGVLLVYVWGRVLFRRPAVAFAAAAILAASAEYVVVSRIVLTDVFLCLFVTGALACFSLGYFRQERRAAAWIGLFVFCALGFLTKGILGALLPFLSIVSFLALSGELALLREFPWAGGLAVFAGIGLPWYALMTARFGPEFLSNFFVHENVRRFFVAEHARFDRFYFYPAGFLAGFFPWTFAVPFAAAYAWSRARSKGRGRGLLFLAVSFAVIFVFFMTARSKLLSYIFPAFPLAALFTARWGYALYRAMRLGARPSRALLGSASLVLGAAPAVLAAGAYLYGRTEEIPLEGGALFFSLTAVPLYGAALVFLFRRRAAAAFACVLAATAAFSLTAFGFLLPRADASFASRRMAEASEKYMPREPGLLVGSKTLVRGMAYYLGHDRMAVLTDDPNGAFYTKHSIPFLSTREDLEELPHGDFPLYLFLQPKQFGFLQRIAPKDLRITVLQQSRQKVFARLDRI